MENEEKIICQNCQEEMTVDKEYVFCSKCGLLLKINWLKEIVNKLLQLTAVK